MQVMKSGPGCGAEQTGGAKSYPLWPCFSGFQPFGWSFLLLLPLLISTGGFGCTASQANASNFLAEAPCVVRAHYRQEIKRDLEEMLALLDAGKQDEFLTEFMDPRVVDRLEAGTGGMFRAEFTTSSLGRELHAAIRAAVNAEPGFGKDADLATFDQAEAGRRLMLRRMDGRWRVLD